MADDLVSRAANRLRRHYRQGTSRLRVLPDFLIIGAMRAGSTSLYSYLAGHPLVGTSTHKEIHFFDLNYHRGLHWYRRHFPSQLARAHARLRHGGELVTGEASPYYVFHPHVPSRVAATLPGVKLIALLRDPVERAYSHYQLEARVGNETLSFEEALDREPERIRSEEERIRRDPAYRSLAHRRFSYLSRGVYADQLERWLSLFPRDQILVLRSEDFFADTGTVFGQVLGFLGLPPYAPPSFPVLNRSPDSAMTPAVRERLVTYFREPNVRLYELLGRDLGWRR